MITGKEKFKLITFVLFLVAFIMVTFNGIDVLLLGGYWKWYMMLMLMILTLVSCVLSIYVIIPILEWWMGDSNEKEA